MQLRYGWFSRIYICSVLGGVFWGDKGYCVLIWPHVSRWPHLGGCWTTCRMGIS